MNKSLLFLASAAMLCSGFASAQQADVTATAITDVMFSKASPNGQWFVSNSEEYVMTIYNAHTGESFVYEATEANLYSSGVGNCISNDGVVLGSTTFDCDAAYWKDGEWFAMPLRDGDLGICLANGITPDGSRVCGSIGHIGLSADDTPEPMQLPVLWTRNADGTYGDYIELPHPNVDLTGRMPQYITAIYISDDGKTVAGQIHDYAGSLDQPIIYTEDADGNWSYSLPGNALFHPEDITFPEYPGEYSGPAYPSYEKYMTPEELQAFTDAEDAFYSGESSDYPNFRDFMSAEELEAYNKANDEYEEAYGAWEEKFFAFEDIYNELLLSVPMMEFNALSLSGNAKYLATMTYDMQPNDDPWSWMPYKLVPETWIFDLAADTHVVKTIDGGINLTQVNNDGGTIGGATVDPNLGIYTRNAYISPSIDDDYMPLQDYVKTLDPALYEWMEQNMRGDYTIEVYNDETEEFDVQTVENAWMTGTPCASADFKEFATWQYEPESGQYLSFILSINDGSGIADAVVGGKALAVKATKGGVITLSGVARELNVFDVQGRKVFSTMMPGAVVATGLNSGVYVVEAVAANGAKTTCKANF